MNYSKFKIAESASTKNEVILKDTDNSKINNKIKEDKEEPGYEKVIIGRNNYFINLNSSYLYNEIKEDNDTNNKKLTKITKNNKSENKIQEELSLQLEIGKAKISKKKEYKDKECKLSNVDLTEYISKDKEKVDKYSNLDIIILSYMKDKNRIKEIISDNTNITENKRKTKINELFDIINNISELTNSIINKQKYQPTIKKFDPNLDTAAIKQHYQYEQKIYKNYEKQYKELKDKYNKLDNSNNIKEELEAKKDELKREIKRQKEKNNELKKEYLINIDNIKHIKYKDVKEECERQLNKYSNEYEKYKNEINDINNKIEDYNQKILVAEDVKKYLEKSSSEFAENIGKIYGGKIFQNLKKKEEENYEKNKKINDLKNKIKILKNTKKIKEMQFKKELIQLKNKYVELEKDKIDVQNRVNEQLYLYSLQKGEFDIFNIKNYIIPKFNDSSSNINSFQ